MCRLIADGRVPAKADTDTAAIFRHKDDSFRRLVNGLDVGPERDREAVILFHAGMIGQETSLQSEPPQPGKFEGGTANVQPCHGIQDVDLNAFHPTQSKAQIPTKVNPDAGAGG
jgi:hypothetical protein